jgi:hypothetical protein
MIDLDEMKRDMEAGTPGPWAAKPLGGCSTVLALTMPPRNDRRSEVSYGYRDSNGFCVGYPFLDAKNETRMDFVCFGHDDARRIARVPDMEAAIIALTAEAEALRARVKAADELADQVKRLSECKVYAASATVKGREIRGWVFDHPDRESEARQFVQTEAQSPCPIYPPLAEAYNAYHATGGAA